MTQTPSTQFERKPCTRCGGSGQYSYCQMHGTTCFGCAGTGKMLTTRGAAARAWYKSRHTIAAEFVKVGDRINSGGAKFTVAEIAASGSYCSHTVDGVTVRKYYTDLFSAGRKFGLGTHAETLVQLEPRNDTQKNEWLREAFAYQDTLGKSGKPLKIKESV